MNLSLSIRTTQRASLEQLSITGGASASLFPSVEGWLAEPDHWGAFRALAGRRAIARFRSVVDLLLVTACPSTESDCMAYYEGAGPQLRDLATTSELLYYERRMLALLELASAALASERQLSWSEAVELIDLMEVA